MWYFPNDLDFESDFFVNFEFFCEGFFFILLTFLFGLSTLFFPTFTLTNLFLFSVAQVVEDFSFLNYILKYFSNSLSFSFTISFSASLFSDCSRSISTWWSKRSSSLFLAFVSSARSYLFQIAIRSTTVQSLLNLPTSTCQQWRDKRTCWRFRNLLTLLNLIYITAALTPLFFHLDYIWITFVSIVHSEILFTCTVSLFVV